MKVLLLSDTFEYGGGERHTADLALALLARDLDVRIASVKPGTPLLDEPAYAPLRPLTDCLGATRYLDPFAVLALRRLVRHYRPDVLLSSNMYALMYAWAGSRTQRHRLPLVSVFHTTVLRDSKQRWQHRLIYDRLVRQTDAFVFLCQFQAAHWRERGLAPGRPQVIYNGIDTQRFRPGLVVERRAAARQALGVEGSDYVVGCNAMLRVEKNHRQLLEAVALLRQQGLPAVAALLGEGALRPALQAQAESLGIARQVRFLGRQSRVEDYLPGFDTGALPSWSETFSLAALEQMAMGIPMVMSRQGGAAEMLSDGEHGYLVPTGDLPALATSLARLHDPVLRARLGAAAAARVAQRFDRATMVDQYVALIRLVTGSGPRSPSDAP